jgi:hypothetical protein
MKVAVTINRNVLDSITPLPREWKPEMRENLEILLLIPVIRFIVILQTFGAVAGISKRRQGTAPNRRPNYRAFGGEAMAGMLFGC